MLNTFPDLLTYSMFAPLILRAVLGLIMINLGFLKFGAEKERWGNLFDFTGLRPSLWFVKIFALVEIIGGLMLIAGIYIQIVALVFILITLSELILELEEEVLIKRNFPFYLLLFTISVSLIFSGAGAFAFDLHL
ncbi:MAG: DoxX family membrane protein [Minisyncoccia bacterium]